MVVNGSTGGMNLPNAGCSCHNTKAARRKCKKSFKAKERKEAMKREATAY